MTDLRPDSETPSAWRPDAMEVVAFLLGAVSLAAALAMRSGPLPKRLPGIALGGGLAVAVLVYLVRSLALLFRRSGEPEALRDAGSGFALTACAIVVSVIIGLSVVPQGLNLPAILTDVDTQQTVGLLGANLPELTLTERHYREAYPVMVLVHEQAERTRHASAEFQRLAEYMRSPLSMEALSDPERRKESHVRISSLEAAGETLEQEAHRLVGKEFLQSLAALSVPEPLKQQIAEATTRSTQFKDTMALIEVSRQMVDHLKRAMAVVDAHLVVHRGQPLLDSPAAATAYNKLIGELKGLAADEERLRQRTMVHIVDDRR